jgi:hypothetical protein
LKIRFRNLALDSLVRDAQIDFLKINMWQRNRYWPKEHHDCFLITSSISFWQGYTDKLRTKFPSVRVNHSHRTIASRTSRFFVSDCNCNEKMELHHGQRRKVQQLNPDDRANFVAQKVRPWQISPETET